MGRESGLGISRKYGLDTGRTYIVEESPPDISFSEEVWEQERSFPEWAQIVADPSRTGPLHEVMLALARAGQHAGVRLREEAGEVRFTHTWLLVMAKPAATHGS